MRLLKRFFILHLIKFSVSRGLYAEIGGFVLRRYTYKNPSPFSSEKPRNGGSELE